MAIALAVGISLIVGVTIMFETRYFWGKESNENINTINSTITNLTGNFGYGNVLMVIMTVVILCCAVMAMCVRAGF